VLGLAAIAVFAAFHVSSAPRNETPAGLWTSIGCVGPFVVGESNRLEPSPVASDAISCIDTASLVHLVTRACGDPKCLIVLVGSADKHPLTGKLEAEFGSNEGLARARAEWVRGQFASALPIDSNRFLVLTAGPREHGIAVEGRRLQLDRAVQVSVLSRGTGNRSLE